MKMHSRRHSNTYQKLADIGGLSEWQSEAVLMWFANKIVAAHSAATGDVWQGKDYDPLEFDVRDDGTRVALSYVFDMTNGGRTHPYESYAQVEEWMTAELVNLFTELLAEYFGGAE